MEDSLRRIISEEEFVGILKPSMSELSAAARLYGEMKGSERFRQFLNFLSERAHEVESFLDEFGARSNRTYSFLGKLVASVRWVSKGLFSLEHLESRFSGYLRDSSDASHDDLRRELDRTRSYLQGALESILSACAVETTRLGCSGEAKDLTKAIPGTNPGKIVLPQNLDELDEVDNEEQRIIEVASRFRFGQEEISKVRVSTPLDDEGAIRKTVRERYDEETARRLEAIIHGLQAKYDTYIRGTGLEKDCPDLRELRGHASIVLHLLEAGTNLVHFHERHESDIRGTANQDRLAKIVTEAQILERIHNLVLVFATEYSRRGREVAERIIPQFTKDVRYDLKVPTGLWVHVRPAHRIVAIVNHYGSPVEMEIDGESCEANSILQVMMLMGNHADARIIRFRGDEKPLGDLRALFDADLGEGEDPLPDQLGYLG